MSKKENYVLMSFCLKKANAEGSVCSAEILQSKSKTIMSKKESYVLMSFCLKNKKYVIPPPRYIADVARHM